MSTYYRMAPRRSRKIRRNRLYINIRVTCPIQANKLLQERGPKLVAVSNDSCPHCVDYKPTWNSFGKMFGRRIHMISMPSSVYSETPLAQKEKVNSVPTVLHVKPDGEVEVVDDMRNKEKIKEIVNQADNSMVTMPVSQVSTGTSNVNPAGPSTEKKASSNIVPLRISGLTEIIPGTSSEKNPLPPVPGTPVQVGGNPWAAFMAAATQAGPAAALMGAYSLLPKKRSSGLMNPTRSRKSRKSRHYRLVPKLRTPLGVNN